MDERSVTFPRSHIGFTTDTPANASSAVLLSRSSPEPIARTTYRARSVARLIAIDFTFC
jgi:hypothetical protein